jgi:regulator of nonsense transcripts 1
MSSHLNCQIVRIETTAKGKPTVVTGSARKVVGRAATISLHSTFLGDKIKSVLTIGKENPTMAEGKRSTVILETLRRSTNLLQLPFVRSIWFPSERLDWPRPIRPSAPLHFPSRTLNPAQKLGVEAILSNHDNNRLCLIHGPPGTGKTTVIAASVTSLAQCRRPVWVIAHSNVAVKNVAEKLADVKFLDFKLLVSMDFHFDWWAHIPRFQCLIVLTAWLS